MLPPRWFRRVVLAPAQLVLSLLVITSLPLLAVLAAVLSPLLPGRWRPLRLLGFALVFVAVESLGLLWAFGLWVAAGFGTRLHEDRWVDAHWRLLRWALGVLVDAAGRSFNLAFRAVGPVPGWDADPTTFEPMPLLVLSRHAGPGDSLLLVHALLQDGHRPRIVLKDVLQWEPLLDVVLNRVPSQFVGGGRSSAEVVAGIGRLAAEMDARDALVLFPEGGNFTPERRVHSIVRLEELGHHERAERARLLRYVLAPRPGGVLAALQAAPTADVVFVAHTGLEQLSGVVDLWRGLPMDTAIEVTAWRVPAGEVPSAARDVLAWLDDWFHRIDRWIVERRGEGAAPDAVVAEVRDDPEEAPPPG